MRKTIVMLILSLVTLCSGQTISLTSKIGPPTSKTSVSGSGFSPHAAIDIYFDTTDVALIFANASGAFSKVNITIDASALPGQHPREKPNRQPAYSRERPCY